MPPWYHGIGIIKLQVKIATDYFNNYHFFSNKLLEQHCEFIHTHLHDFNSKVLQGELLTEIYEYDPHILYDAEYLLEESMCTAGEVPRTIYPNVEVKLVNKFTTEKDESYILRRTEFHKLFIMSDHAVTYTRHTLHEDTVKAQFIRKKTDPFVCAFESPMEEDRCWEIIEAILNDK